MKELAESQNRKCPDRIPATTQCADADRGPGNPYSVFRAWALPGVVELEGVGGSAAAYRRVRSSVLHRPGRRDARRSPTRGRPGCRARARDARRAPSARVSRDAPALELNPMRAVRFTSTAPRIHPKNTRKNTWIIPATHMFHSHRPPPHRRHRVTRPASFVFDDTSSRERGRGRSPIGRTSLLYVPSRPAHRRHAMRATCVANHDLSTSSSFAGTRRGASYGRQIRSSARFVCVPRCGDVSAARGVLSPSLARAATGALAML